MGAFSFISFISFCFLKFVFCDGFFLFIPLLGANGLAGRGVSYQKVLLISLWSLFINLGLFFNAPFVSFEKRSDLSLPMYVFNCWHLIWFFSFPCPTSLYVELFPIFDYFHPFDCRQGFPFPFHGVLIGSFLSVIYAFPFRTRGFMGMVFSSKI